MSAFVVTMKMCKDYWYHYSDVSVNKSTAVNYVNHTTLERDTPKAPPKKVTLIESTVKPRGLFIVDGVPVPRSEVAAAARASLPTISPLASTSTAVASTAHPAAPAASTAVTVAPKASTLSLSHPRSLSAPRTLASPSRTSSQPLGLHTMTSTAVSNAPNSSPLHTLLRTRQSAGADRTFTALMTLHHEDDVVFSGSVAAATTAPSSPATASGSSGSGTQPFPLWEKYPHRLTTPAPEIVVQRRQEERRQAGAHYTHIYHDNNFVRAPSQSAENPFTRLVLPGYAEHRSLQKRQAVVATERSKLSLITR